MPSFRQVANGYVPDTLSDAELTATLKNLNLLRKDAYSDFTLVLEGHVAVETLHAVTKLVGPSFRAFLEANYDSGRGPLANLIKDIAHYLNGRVGHQNIVTHLRVEERKLYSASRARAATYAPTRTAGNALPLLEDGYVVHDYDLYRLMAGLSPANVGRLLMLIGGESYYV